MGGLGGSPLRMGTRVWRSCVLRTTQRAVPKRDVTPMGLTAASTARGPSGGVCNAAESGTVWGPRRSLAGSWGTAQLHCAQRPRPENGGVRVCRLTPADVCAVHSLPAPHPHPTCTGTAWLRGPEGSSASWSGRRNSQLVPSAVTLPAPFLFLRVSESVPQVSGPLLLLSLHLECSSPTPRMSTLRPSPAASLPDLVLVSEAFLNI